MFGVFLVGAKFIEETSNDPSCNHIVVVFSGDQTPAERPSRTDVPFLVIKLEFFASKPSDKLICS